VASAPELVRRLAEELGVDPRRLFLTAGATEANAWVAWFLGRRTNSGTRRVRVHFPEYPPLVDVAKWAGFTVAPPSKSATLAVVSLPRNPEGVLWSDNEFADRTRGVRSVLVDETFRPFAGSRSHARRGEPGLWTTGSFTKFYAGDDVRVGFAVAPPDDAEAFARFHGLVTDELTPFSLAAALRILDAGDGLARPIRRQFEKNRAVLAQAVALDRPLCAPVYFDRVPDGDRLARRCLRRSILVCPGRFFGTPAGVRISLTRRTFARDLGAYLVVRGSAR
jgi:aspartate/methionine/tyrosine aminotransferase